MNTSSVLSKILFFISITVLVTHFTILVMDTIEQRTLLHLVIKAIEEKYSLAIDIDRSLYLDSHFHTRSKTILFLSIALIASMYITIFIIIKKPLSKIQHGLTQSFEYLKSGNFKFETIKINTNDEFSAMAEVLNENSKIGTRLHREADNLNKILETRVEKRTSELKEAFTFMNMIVDELKDIVFILKNDQVIHTNKRFKKLFPQIDHKELSTIAALKELSKNGYDYGINTQKLSEYTLVTLTDITDLNNEIKCAINKNPLTKLPGNDAIENYLSMLMKEKTDNLIVYFDFDNFKPFNDKYGFAIGDKGILLFSDLLKSSITFPNSFIGHIGGDDFFCGIKGEHINDYFRALKHLLYDFQDEAKQFYSKEDIKQGRVVLQSREGEKKFYPLLSVSAVILHLNTEKNSYSLDTVMSEIAKLKKLSKKEPHKYVYTSLIGE